MRYIALFLLTTTMALAAPKHAPLPEAVTQAKTIYLSNRTGKQDVVDAAYDALSKWGRFTIVTSKDKADLVAILDETPSLQDGTTILSVRLLVTAKDSEDPLYEDTEWAKGFHTPTSRLALSAKNCVSAFRKRLEQ